jgi:hypothetical protein
MSCAEISLLERVFSWSNRKTLYPLPFALVKILFWLMRHRGGKDGNTKNYFK